MTNAAGPAPTAEFPGFHLPGSPVFNVATGAGIGFGDYPDATTVLDLAMVFGSRLWGHGEDVTSAAATAAPGLGDLFTHELRERASAALCARVAGELAMPADRWRALVLHTGSEAVETALKTALRATGRAKMVAFTGAYHGTFGMALAVTHSQTFRSPWHEQLPNTVTWSPWGYVPALDEDVACVIVEPWQGRAGVIPPPGGFLRALREECNRVGAVLVIDAVLCGAGRTGATIAEGIREARPDIVCLGKAIGGGVAASAVVARETVATAAWEHGSVEPAHTSTLVGDPVACSGILHALTQLETRGTELQEQSAAWQELLEDVAERTGLALRGTGLLWALDTGRAGGGADLAARLLAEHQVLVVPSGNDGRSITLYPSVVCSPMERNRAHDALLAAIGAVR